MTVKQAISILDGFIDSVNISNEIDSTTIKYVYLALDYLEKHCELMNEFMKLKYGDEDE